MNKATRAQKQKKIRLEVTKLQQVKKSNLMSHSVMYNYSKSALT